MYCECIINLCNVSERCQQYNGTAEGTANCSHWTFYPPNHCMLLQGCVPHDDPAATSGDSKCPPALSCPEKDYTCVSRCNASNVISRPNVKNEQDCSSKYLINIMAICILI